MDRILFLLMVLVLSGAAVAHHAVTVAYDTENLTTIEE